MVEVSQRLIDQRVRNRVIELAHGLCGGDAYVETVGAVEWINSFFDWFPLQDQQPVTNSAMTADELQAVSSLREMMVQASSQTSRVPTDGQLQATGWPDRIRPHAERLLKLMQRRGRFSEDAEEAEPLSPIL